jgi:hypothetical protein
MTRLALLLLAALALPAALAAPVYDQLHNGSFEKYSQGQNSQGVPTALFDSWTLEVGVANASSLATDGHVSAELRALPNQLGGHYSILAQTIPQSSTDAPIVPGAFYDLSFDALGSYHGGKGVGHANVMWIGSRGEVLRVDTIDVPEGTAFASYSAHLQAPIDPVQGDAATSATIRFRVDGFSSDTDVDLWVDNAHFGLGTPA